MYLDSNPALPFTPRCEPSTAQLLRSRTAEDCLRESYWEMLHNVSLYSHIYGSVGVFKGLPFYCDGHQLIVIGYSVDQSMKDLPRRMSGLITNVLDEHGDHLTAIEFWGPIAPDETVIPNSLSRSWSQRPTSENRDVILTLDRSSTWDALALRRDVKRAIRSGLHVAVGQKTVTAEHQLIFSTFLRSHHAIDLEEKKYVRCWRAALHQQDSVIVNVYKEERLTGFAILSLFGLRIATYAYGFFDNTVAGTSDLAHASMIALCRERGFQFLDLGHSIHNNLLRYKQKWGETGLVSPPWCLRWTKQRERKLQPVRHISSYHQPSESHCGVSSY